MIAFLVALALTGTWLSPAEPWEIQSGDSVEIIGAKLFLALVEEAQRRAAVQSAGSLIGTWLSPTELAVQAEVPAVTLPATWPWERQVPWVITAYRYDEGCFTWPCRVAGAFATVPEGQTATIAATLRIAPPHRDWGTVELVLSNGLDYDLDQRSRLEWPFAILFGDGFESCGRRCLPECAPPPPLCSHLVWWSGSRGHDPAVVFSDGFETGTAERWSGSAP